MKLIPADKAHPTLVYLGKVFITVFLYYFSSNITAQYLTFLEIFHHEDYTTFWPPSGIALGLMLMWGPSIWPGIFIGSVLRTLSAAWFLESNPEIIDAMAMITIFAAGRTLESLTGYFLLKKADIADYPFKTIRSTIYFIMIAIVIGTISAGAGSISTDLIRNDTGQILLVRTFGWYIGNVIGILIFTPLTFAMYQLIKKKSYFETSYLIPITVISAFTFLFIYFIRDLSLEVHNVLEDSLPFLIIPVLLWIAYRFNLIISSFSVFLISIFTIYFTALFHGYFIINNNTNFHHTVGLIQSFVFVIAIASLIFHAASNERKEYLIRINEAKVKAENSEQLKSAFLANMSHEIRTPMNAIMGFSELLNRQNLSDKKREEFTQLIRLRSKDLLCIVNDILDISKIESGQMMSVPSTGNIHELLEQLKKNITAEINHLHHKSIEVKLNNELQGTQNIVMADFLRLQQALSNLLNNALKFTEEGTIEFGCKMQDKKTLLFYVRDTGIGIDPSKHDIIFQPFQQASLNTHKKYGGTGLGLAIINGLTKLWNGKIWVESAIGKGSSFFFTMPYHPQSKPNTNDEVVTDIMNWKDVNLLLVEDDASSANYIREIISGFPCELRHATNGLQAIEATMQMMPSVVLLDLGLPDMPGLMVMEKLKNINPNMIIVVITAFATTEFKLKTMEAGANAFLTKPINQHTLVSTLISVMQNKN